MPPNNCNSPNLLDFDDNIDFKNDKMEDFEEVVCEELVDTCLEQMRKHSARYSELDVITELSGESSSLQQTIFHHNASKLLQDP